MHIHRPSSGIMPPCFGFSTQMKFGSTFVMVPVKICFIWFFGFVSYILLSSVSHFDKIIFRGEDIYLTRQTKNVEIKKREEMYETSKTTSAT